MLKQFTSQDVLIKGLREGDCQSILKCLEAGQSLNDNVGRDDWPLILYLIDQQYHPQRENAILTLLGFKELVDIDVIATCTLGVTCCPLTLSFGDAKITHALLQSGASLDISQMGISDDYHPFYVRVSHLYRNDEAILGLLMLLAAGMEPDDKSIQFMKDSPNSNVTKVLLNYCSTSLASLQCAKAIFQKLFDNSALEQEICEFVFTEHHSRKITLITGNLS